MHSNTAHLCQGGTIRLPSPLLAFTLPLVVCSPPSGERGLGLPTAKPRITVTLDERIYETIDRMAELTGYSRASIINDLLTAAHDPLIRTVAVLEAAQRAPAEARASFLARVQQIEQELEGAAGETLHQFALLTSALSDPVDSGNGVRERTWRPKK